jgi:hypothetical protein
MSATKGVILIGGNTKGKLGIPMLTRMDHVLNERRYSNETIDLGHSQTLTSYRWQGDSPVVSSRTAQS